MVTVKTFGVIRAVALYVLVAGVSICQSGCGKEQSAWGIGNTGANVAERTEEAVGKWQ